MKINYAKTKRSNENVIYEWYEMNSFGGCCNKCDQCKQKLHVLNQIFSKKLKYLFESALVQIQL